MPSGLLYKQAPGIAKAPPVTVVPTAADASAAVTSLQGSAYAPVVGLGDVEGEGDGDSDGVGEGWLDDVAFDPPHPTSTRAANQGNTRRLSRSTGALIV